MFAQSCHLAVDQALLCRAPSGRLWLPFLVGVGALLAIWCLHRELLDELFVPLPGYELKIEGADRDSAQDRTDALVLRREMPIEIRLHPRHPPTLPVFLHMYVAHSETVRSLVVLPERTEDGTLLLRGMLRDVLDLARDAAGAHELIVGVSHWPGPMSYDRIRVQASLTPQGAAERLIRRPLMIRPLDEQEAP